MRFAFKHKPKNCDVIEISVRRQRFNVAVKIKSCRANQTQSAFFEYLFLLSNAGNIPNLKEFLLNQAATPRIFSCGVRKLHSR